MARPLRCHRCRSTELVLREFALTCGEWQDGLFLDEGGRIVAQGEAIFNPDSIKPELTQIECLDCGHTWHPRRWFAGAEG